MIRIGVIGWGYWGPNLGRNVSASAGCRLAGVADQDAGRLALAGRAHPDVELARAGETLLADPGIDAIVIATPVRTHFALARAALRAGKHVLIEKPLTQSSEEALILIEESERRGLVLMVDHTFVYSPPVRAIHALLSADGLGRLLYYDSVRVNLGLVRNDVNVLWDVAAHDLALLDHLLPSGPATIHAAGIGPAPGSPEHLAYLTLSYPDGFHAHVHASWMSPVKIRRILMGGSRRMLLYDDLAPADRVTLYDCDAGHPASRGTAFGELGRTEPLRAVVEHFVDCIEGASRPITDGVAGLRVVRQLEAADQSLEEGGRIIELDGEGVPA
jgi:predicted dehydrogenase